MATKHGFVTRQWQRLLFFHCLFILFLYSEDDAFSVSPEGVLHDLGGGGLVATIVNVVNAFHHLFKERSHAEIEFGRNLSRRLGGWGEGGRRDGDRVNSSYGWKQNCGWKRQLESG